MVYFPYAFNTESIIMLTEDEQVVGLGGSGHHLGEFLNS